MRTFCIKKNIIYREIKVNHPNYNKFYLIDNPNHEEITAIPDGCVDMQWVWKEQKAEVHLCGSFLQGKISPIGQYDRCFGIKFNLGIIPNIDHLRAEEIVNNRCILKYEEKKNQMIEYASKTFELGKMVTYFIEVFKDLEYYADNPIVQSMIQKIQNTSGLLSIKQLASDIGYSQCYTDRIFKQSIGINVKKYANIIRCQYAISYIESNEEGTLYECLGYYDQAHFINNFKKFTSYTPCSYKRNIDKILIV